MRERHGLADASTPPTGAAVVSFPRLTVQQYASLCTELALWPTRSGEILPRYHVMNEAARRALSEHWQAEIAASAEVRGRFVKSLAHYTAWLRAQGRSAGVRSPTRPPTSPRRPIEACS